MSVLDSVHVPHLVSMHVFHRNRLFLECVTAAIASHTDFRVTAGDPDAFISELEADELRPDVVLIDMQLPNRGAVVLLERIRSASPQTKCLVLVPHDDPEAVIDCVAAGAVGCVLEESSLRELSGAVCRVLQGETFCSPQLVSSMFQQLTQLSREPITQQLAVEAPLTRRELEILNLLADGLSNQDIANHLSLSLYTVKNHVHNILEKLDVENRFHAIEHARRRRLLPRTRLTAT